MAWRADRLAALGLALALQAPAAADEGIAAVVLRWQAVPGAAAYEVEVARDRAFAVRVVAERTEVPGYRWRAIPEARYFWRVRSLDASGRAGPWSETKVIEAALAAPVPLGPDDRARFTWDRDGRTATFAAAPSELLKEYRLEVADEPGFARPLLSRRSPSPSFRVDLPGLGTFHWRIGAVALDGREAPWSAARTFEVELGAPRLLAPAPGAALPFGPFDVSWETLRPAARWRVTVAREAEAPRQLDAAAPPLRVSPERPGRHRVRVAAVLPDGRPGPASEPIELLVEPPAALPPPRLSSPEADAARDDPAGPVAFAWEPVPGSAGHQLQVAPPDALERSPVRPAAGARLEVAGLPPGPLAWRARALDAFGGPGAWSEVRSLHLGPRPAARIEIALDEPALVADGAASTRLSIRLLDATGRAVPGSPSVEASAGRVEGLSPAGEGWEARYVAPALPPPGGAAEIGVRERDLVARARVELSPEVRRLALGAMAGWRTNLAALSSPSLTLEATWRTPLLGDRLLLAARVSGFAETAAVPPTGALAYSPTSTARVFPVALLAFHEWPLGAGDVYAGAGLGADLVWITAGHASQLAASPAASVALGASWPAGPGRVLVEVAGAAGSVDTSLATLRTGGFSLSAGYRLTP